MNGLDFTILEGGDYPQPFVDIYNCPCEKCGRSGYPRRVVLGYGPYLEYVEMVCRSCDHKYWRFLVLTEADLSPRALPANASPP